MRQRPEASVEEHFRHAMTHSEQVIGATPQDQAAAIDSQQWIEELCARHHLPHVEEAGEPYCTHETSSEVYEDYGRQTPIEVEYLVVHWPLKDHPSLSNLLSLRPSIFHGSVPECYYWEGKLQFRIRIGTIGELDREHVQDAARKNLDGAIKCLREEFAALNRDVDKWSPALHHHVAEAVKRRKAQIGQKNSAIDKLAATMSVPLRKKTEVPPKVLYLKPAKPTSSSETRAKLAAPAEEMTLDPVGFSTLLKYMERYLRDCERTPETFVKLKEEEVRNLLLPYLNQVFEGGATGETFSKYGKTDIYLLVKKGRILICECKWWNGPESLRETSQQILDRVTWRENFGIALIFVRTPFERALQGIRETIARLPSNRAQQAREVTAGHFAATLEASEERLVEVHYLVCNFVG